MFGLHALYLRHLSRMPAPGWANAGVVDDALWGFGPYLRAQDYFTGFAYGLAAAFGTWAAAQFLRRRRAALAAGAVGSLSLVAVLLAGGCFLIGCCGSPMLAVYLGIFGAKALGAGKPLVAVVTLLSTGCGYCCLSPRFKRRRSAADAKTPADRFRRCECRAQTGPTAAPTPGSPARRMVFGINRAHRLFQVGIVLKAIDGALEVIGGAALVNTPPEKIRSVVAWLTRAELQEDPTDLVANHLVRYFHHLSVSATHFASLYLVVYGLTKIGLAAGLLAEKLWAYPTALVILGALFGYQVSRLISNHSLVLGTVTLLDLAILALIWGEYRRLRESRSAPG